ncbi:porin [Methylomonas paludis]|uniref:Porin n=1 Tax=Methylomonas paludis TaxID=1173101 RepID=A0A975MNV1_9GAMM|nr:porin [Methylomonas paludis]QWF71311.1 porin [Methylomonas paludis]
MKLTKLSLAIVTALGAGAISDALALDLYVDSKTQQIFAEPGPGRTKLGTFQRVEDSPNQQVETAQQKAEIDKIKEDLALKTNELKAIDEHLKDPTEGKLHIDEKGIKFESKDGNFDMAITGRMQVDSQSNVSGLDGVGSSKVAKTDQPSDGANIRRARLGLEGSFYKDYEYKFEYDFSRGNGTVAAGITDAYINWKGYDPFGLKVGSFKEPFSLEEATSNRWTTFIERNMAVNSFSDNPNAYKTGLGLNYAQPRWTAAGAFLTEPVGGGWAYNSSLNGGYNSAAASSAYSNINGNQNRSNGSGDTGWELTGRVTTLPWFEDKNKFVHLGASGSQRQVNNNYDASGNLASGGMTFNATIDGNVDRTSVLNTGSLTNIAGKNAAHRVNKITRFGGEGAVVYKSLSAQAEYIQTDVSGIGYTNESLNGYYGFVSYFLTGESRTYKAKTGAWDRIKPNSNFSTHGGGWGAWELAAGYDYLNLNSGVIHGGRASTGKFGINWYPMSHVKLMANLIHYLNVDTADINVVKADGSTDAAATARSKAYNSANLDTVEARVQVDF